MTPYGGDFDPTTPERRVVARSPFLPISLPAFNQSRFLSFQASGNRPNSTFVPYEVISASAYACSFKMTEFPKPAPETVSSSVDAISSDFPGLVFSLPESGQTDPLDLFSMPEFDFFLSSPSILSTYQSS